LTPAALGNILLLGVTAVAHKVRALSAIAGTSEASLFSSWREEIRCVS